MKKREFQIHFSAEEHHDGNDSSVTEIEPEIGSAERETETAQELSAADRKRRKDLRAQKRPKKRPS